MMSQVTLRQILKFPPGLNAEFWLRPRTDGAPEQQHVPSDRASDIPISPVRQAALTTGAVSSRSEAGASPGQRK